MCASRVPITKMLFGDKLQTQLNNMRALNKISKTTSSQGGNKGYSKQRGLHSTSTGRNFFRENLSDEPAEQPRSEQPLKEKRSPLVGDLLSDQGISKEASELILKSWRTGTQKQYRTYLERWKLFCPSRKVNPLCGTVTNGIDFFGHTI